MTATFQFGIFLSEATAPPEKSQEETVALVLKKLADGLTAAHPFSPKSHLV